jgi:hypothetical protein
MDICRKCGRNESVGSDKLSIMLIKRMDASLEDGVLEVILCDECASCCGRPVEYFEMGTERYNAFQPTCLSCFLFRTGDEEELSVSYAFMRLTTEELNRWILEKRLTRP